MCLVDSIEEIQKAVEALKKAKDALDTFNASTQGGTDADVWGIGDLSTHEARSVHTARVERAESALKELGFRGPLAKAAPADPADSQRVINQR